MKKILTLALLLLPVLSFADEGVPPLYTTVAEAYRVPSKLFYALMLNESRSLTTTSESRKVLPWPWTVNHRGEPHFFPNKERAYLFAKSLVESGDEQFDVGLGQLNWRWQKHRFYSLRDAFDPYLNLCAAAKHLREQYDRPECRGWDTAVGCYHRPGQRSSDKEIAKNYTKRVYSLWAQI
jgi:hypothetical protein